MVPLACLSQPLNGILIGSAIFSSSPVCPADRHRHRQCTLRATSVLVGRIDTLRSRAAAQNFFLKRIAYHILLTCEQFEHVTA